MTDDLVSVVIPTYDRPEMLARAVMSVVEQRYDQIELIVIDDASPEPIAPIVEDLPIDSLEGSEVIRHETNRNGAAARNTGIRAASGEYIAFLDDDDVWHPEFLRTQVVALERLGNEYGLVYTGARGVTTAGEIEWELTRSISGDSSRSILLGNFVGGFSRILIRSELADRAGLIDERFSAWVDWGYYIRLAQHCRFGVVPEPLVTRYVDHTTRTSHDYWAKRHVSEHLLQNLLLPIASEHGWRYERKVVASLYLNLGKWAIIAGEFEEARRWLLKAVATYPLIPALYPYLGAVIGGKRTLRAARAVKQRVGVIDSRTTISSWHGGD
ncbi:glycosyltransferase family 2 protein [Natronorarus salvus]|uniref:glycosyltransferase family 2 protein n=1 Tax=Natronorarus salvus TaxID=3117733 RepID=UPI002F269427